MCRLLKVLSAFNKGFTLCHIIQLAILCLIELPLFKITDLMNVTRLLILQTKTKEMFIKTNISAILQRKKNMYNCFFDLPIVNKFSFFSKAFVLNETIFPEKLKHLPKLCKYILEKRIAFCLIIKNPETHRGSQNFKSLKTK